MKNINQNQCNEWLINNESYSINPFILMVFILLLALQACEKKDCEDGACSEICKTDPCGNPIECPGQCPTFDNGTLSKSNLKGEGIVV